MFQISYFLLKGDSDSFFTTGFSSSLDDEILRFFLTTVLTGDDSGL
jgi:hypothetical protein